MNDSKKIINNLSFLRFEFVYIFRQVVMDLVWSRDAEKLNNKLNSAFPDHSYFTDYGGSRRKSFLLHVITCMVVVCLA